MNPGAGGIPLFALHGGPGATHDYLDPLGRLRRGTARVFYAQLGGGNSDRPDDPSLWTIERFAEELAVFEDAPHSHHLEKAAKYLALVGAFLSRAESPRARDHCQP
ncbi:MAG: hypothetical protein WCP22_02120 [Chlamydiota bacterium]